MPVRSKLEITGESSDLLSTMLTAYSVAVRVKSVAFAQPEHEAGHTDSDSDESEKPKFTWVFEFQTGACDQLLY